MRSRPGLALNSRPSAICLHRKWLGALLNAPTLAWRELLGSRWPRISRYHAVLRPGLLLSSPCLLMHRIPVSVDRFAARAGRARARRRGAGAGGEAGGGDW